MWEEDFPQSRCIESGVFPYISMASAVGAEGGVADPTRILNRVTILAGGIEDIPMKGNPVWVQVRFGFRSTADLDLSDKIIRSSNHRNRVAYIAFKSYSLALVV